MSRLPALFLSHGSPMMALKTPDIDPYVRCLNELGKRLPIPRAICMISSHWYVRWKYISMSQKPETIYDFGGFPDELYRLRYEASGFPEWADLLRGLIPEITWNSTERWLDHGAWTVLMHLFPEANIPVFSISVDATDSPEEHFKLGQKLHVLRDNWILVIATGNIVHNLYEIDFDPSKDGYGSEEARQFDQAVAGVINRGEYKKLFIPENIPGGRYAVPTPDHFLPLLTILGMADANERLEWIYRGYELGSISRSSFGFGV